MISGLVNILIIYDIQNVPLRPTIQQQPFLIRFLVSFTPTFRQRNDSEIHKLTNDTTAISTKYQRLLENIASICSTKCKL